MKGLRMGAAMGLAALTSVGLGAEVATAATVNVSGTVCTCGTWTTYENVRAKAGYGDISMRVTNNVSTTLVITLTRSDGTVFTSERAFTGTPVDKVVGSGVLDRTNFRIRARMYANRASDHYWVAEPLRY